MVAGDIDDRQLLEQYASLRSQTAFAELVRRHLGLVYYTALRRVGGDRHLAQDVAQTVFIALAKKAHEVKSRPALAGWLFTSARFAAAQAVRTERRRHQREQEAQLMDTFTATASLDWERLGPLLDDAVEDLTAKDRELVLLRFRENRSYVEIGPRYEMTPDAVRRRVERALERMRRTLVNRGVPSTAAALAAAITSQAAQAAPADLGGKIVAGVFSHVGAAASVGAGAKVGATIVGWKIAASVAIVAVGAGAWVIRERSSPVPPAPTVTEASNRPKATRPTVAIATTQVGTGTTASAQAPVAIGYMPAERQLQRLEALINTLTPDQRQQAFQIFQNLTDAMDSIPAADRANEGASSRQSARAAIRALLTPDQQKVYDVSPQSQGGGSMAAPAAVQSRNAEIRAAIRAFVRGSSEIAAAVGAVRAIRPLESVDSRQASNDSATQVVGGSTIVRVVGDQGTHVFQVNWKASDSDSVQVTGIVPLGN